MLARAVATSVGAAGENGFIYVKGVEVLSKWVGESEATVRSIFDRARDHNKRTGKMAVIFIDEADALLGCRSDGGTGRLTSTLVPSFLAEMDGLDDSGAFVMLSTNRPDTLDPAIVRDGRIDRRIRVGRPNQASTAEIFRLAMRGRPCASLDELTEHASSLMHSERYSLYEISFEGHAAEYIRLRDMLSGAVVAGIVNRATANAIRRDRGTDRNPAITRDDVESAVWASFQEMADTTHTELIFEKLEQVGRVPSQIRKAHLNAGVQETQFRTPISYSHAKVQGIDGNSLN